MKNLKNKEEVWERVRVKWLLNIKIIIELASEVI